MWSGVYRCCAPKLCTGLEKSSGSSHHVLEMSAMLTVVVLITSSVSDNQLASPAEPTLSQSKLASVAH